VFVFVGVTELPTGEQAYPLHAGAPDEGDAPGVDEPVLLGTGAGVEDERGWP